MRFAGFHLGFEGGDFFLEVEVFGEKVGIGGGEVLFAVSELHLAPDQLFLQPSNFFLLFPVLFLVENNLLLNLADYFLVFVGEACLA